MFSESTLLMTIMRRRPRCRFVEHAPVLTWMRRCEMTTDGGIDRVESAQRLADEIGLPGCR